jgi:hypothetical protein
MTTPDPARKYIVTKQLRQRWGNCSHMTIERKLKNESPTGLVEVHYWFASEEDKAWTMAE